MTGPRLDLDGLFRSRVGAQAGLDPGEFDRTVRMLADPVQLEVVRSASGFLEVGSRGPAFLEAVEAATPRVPFEHVLVVGMGGSALGIRALVDALGSPGAAVHVLDTVDPATLRDTFACLSPSSTVVNVVSKSGGTLETIAAFGVVLGWLRASLSADEVRRRVVVTTRPDGGPLRAWAAREGWATLDVPPDVGGRYSVLTPVGLFPASLAGLDVAALVDGASVATRSDVHRVAVRLAAAIYLLDARGRSIHVVWAYDDRLLGVGRWLLQLYAESLGKRTPDGRSVGPTPILARGPGDQHSQLQLYVDGPPDKAFLFLDADDKPGLHTIVADVPDELAYLGGRSSTDVLDACRRATLRVLTDAGRPTAEVRLAKVDEAHLGTLLQMFMLSVALAGTAYGINPFDQPGVEAGKNHACSLLREGGS